MQNNYEELAAKTEALIEQTQKRAAAICKRHEVPQDVIDVYTADVVDMLRAQFNGLRATTEQMQQLTTAVQQRSWDRTGNAALCFIAQYYKNIAEALNGAPTLGNSFLHAVEYYEIAKRKGIQTPKILIDYLGAEDETEKAWKEAQRLYYTYAVLIIAELTEATADELTTLQPNGVEIDATKKARCIASGLDFQRQRKQIEQRKTTRTGAADPTTDARAIMPVLPNILASDRTIQQYQNITYMLGGGLQTADVDADGRTSVLRPLRTAIKEQQQRAALIATDRYANEQQRRQAEELIATTTAVYQVMDGIQILPQILKPDSGRNDYNGYYLTPYLWAQICTQQDKPNAIEVRNILCATKFLRTQSTRVWQKATRRVKLTDGNGNVVYDEHGKTQYRIAEIEKFADFMPLHAEFFGEREAGVEIEKVTRLHVEIHKIIIDGRSGNYVVDDSTGRKERLFIKRPATHILTLEQFTDFKSDEERIFRSIVISTFSNPQKGIPAHMSEETLLARVFDYEARQTEYDKAAAEVHSKADAVNANPQATDTDKEAAAAMAKKAADKAKYYITNHMGNDVDALRNMFEKALRGGLIKYYDRKEAAHKTNTKKYGSNYVWVWERPDAVTGLKKHI